jgi:NAD(P)-dependent dehydrogenase (short-subunit alcohol dehydrogenase family)
MGQTLGVQLRGAAVLVTGGRGGIGRALVDAFAAAGADPTALDVAGTGADVEIDVTDAAAMAAAIEGLGRLDVVVANAGVGQSGLVEDLDRARWDAHVDVNVGGVLNTVLPAYERMRAQRSGALVLMASVAGLLGTPLMVPYGMTKAAIVGLGAGLRAEAARHGVDVVVVCPGPVDTRLLDDPSSTPGVSVRRYLTAAGGRPIPPATLAARVVDAVRSGRPFVVPGRAATLWRLSRIAPRLTEREIARGLRKELDVARRSPR